MLSLIRQWLSRREMRRKVAWSDCVWSPQKAAEKRMAAYMVDQYQRAIGIQLREAERQAMESMRIAQLIRMQTIASHERAIATYRHAYEAAKAADKRP